MKVCILFSVGEQDFDFKKFEKYVQDCNKINYFYSYIFYVGEKNKNVLKELNKKKIQNIQVNIVKDIYDDDKVVKDFLIKYDGDCLIVTRSSFNSDNFYIINKMIKKHEEGANIVILKTEKPKTLWFKIQTFFNKIINFMIMFFYGFGLYDNDISICLYDKNVVGLLKNLPNKITKLTKINNFVGYNIETVTSHIKPIKLKTKNPKLINTLIWQSTFAAILMVYIILCVFVPSVNVFVFHVPMLLLIVPLFVTAVFQLISLYLFKKLGELYDKDLPIIKIKKEKKNEN